jgi:hypothetical protein
MSELTKITVYSRNQFVAWKAMHNMITWLVEHGHVLGPARTGRQLNVISVRFQQPRDQTLFLLTWSSLQDVRVEINPLDE